MEKCGGNLMFRGVHLAATIRKEAGRYQISIHEYLAYGWQDSAKVLALEGGNWPEPTNWLKYDRSLLISDIEQEAPGEQLGITFPQAGNLKFSQKFQEPKLIGQGKIPAQFRGASQRLEQAFYDSA